MRHKREAFSHFGEAALIMPASNHGFHFTERKRVELRVGVRLLPKVLPAFRYFPNTHTPFG